MEYTPKPQPRVTENVWIKSLLSMLAFLGVYYFLFDRSLLSAVSVVLVLLVHEGGHYAAMKYFGYEGVKMFFMPFMGAFVSGEKEKTTQAQQIIVILAGPLPGIAIGLALDLVAHSLNYPSLERIADLFVYINAFNLLPIIPLDGGRLIETMFAGTKEIVLSIFMVLSIIMVALLAYFLETYTLLILVVFLFLRLRLLWQTKNVREYMKEIDMDYYKSYSELSDEEYHAMKKVLLERIPDLKKEAVKEDTITSMIKGILNDSSTRSITTLTKVLIMVVWLTFLIVVPVVHLVWND